MPDLANVISNISDGETVSLDESQTWTLGSNPTTNADNWTIEGNGTRVNVSGTPSIRLNGTGWFFGGFWWDVSGCRQVTINTGTSSGDWRMERLGWPQIDCSDHRVTMRCGTASGTTGRIDRCYFGGGHGGMAMLNSNGRHQGHLHVTRVWVEQHADNGFYGVDSGKDGASCNQGTWEVEDSHFRDNNISNVRIGTYDGPSYVRNCTFNVTSAMPTHSNGGRNRRGVWCYYGDVYVEDCTFNLGRSNALLSRGLSAGASCPGNEPIDSGCSYNVPDPYIPSGVPTTPQEAAQGDSSGGDTGGGEWGDGDSGHQVVNLGDEGLSNGDYIDPYLEDYWDTGYEVRIPAGEYEFDGTGLSGTYGGCWLLGSANGVTFNRPGTDYQVRPSIRASSGEVKIENITIRGQKGELQSRWRLDPNGGDIHVVNVNFPDGTVSPSDSQAFYSEGSSGTLYVRNCYFGGHGNSLIYATYSDIRVEIENCQMMNSNGAVRPSPQGVRAINCDFYGDGFVPQFSQDGGAAEGAYNRMIKVEHPCEVIMEDCGFYQTTDCSSPGPVLDDQEGAHGYVENLFIYNETGATTVRGAGGVSGSNVNISGPGDQGIPWPDSGDAMPATSDAKQVWTPITGTGGGDGGPSLPNHIEYRDDPDTIGQSDYTIEFTNGPIEKSDAGDATINSGDTIDGTTVTGFARGGVDAYDYRGEIWQMSVDGAYEDILVNGESVTPAEVSYDHYIVIVGDGTDTNFEFGTTGEAKGIQSGPDQVESGQESITHTFAGAEITGNVIGGNDGFLYNGDIHHFSTDGSIDHVEIDGQQVDHTTLGDGVPSPRDYDHVIQLFGAEFATTDYSFTTSGNVVKKTSGSNPAEGDQQDYIGDPPEGTDDGVTGGNESYDTITLATNEQRTIHLDDGDSFTNYIIDQRADGAHCRINTSGNVDNFEIRNIGFLGIPRGQEHIMNLAGNGVVENVFADGRRRNGENGTQMGGIRMKRGHSGTIEIRNTFIAGMGNNASYASSAGKNNGGGGAVIYDSCYHRDNTASNYRPGTSGSRIRNCVSIVNDPNCLRGPYPHSGAKGSRGAWVKHYPDQRIENSSFYISPDDCNPNETVEARHFDKSDGPGVEVTIADTGVNADHPNGFNERSEAGGYATINFNNLHNSPSVDVLQNGGVPLNPEMAASAGRAMPPAIDEQVPPGGMEPDTSDGGGETRPVADGEGTTVVGSVIDAGGDTCYYNGTITSFVYQTDANDGVAFQEVEIDGAAVDPDNVASYEPPDDGDGGSDPGLDPAYPDSYDPTKTADLLGRIDVAADDGWYEIGAYDPATDLDTALEIETENGVALIPTTDPGSSDSLVEMYAGGAWTGLTGMGYTSIESFEAGGLGTTWTRNHLNEGVVQSEHVVKGNYSARLDPDTATIICSGPDYANGLPYYPKPGDRWAVYFRWDGSDPDHAAPHAEHRFGCQEWPYGDGFLQEDIGASYIARVHWHRDELQIGKQSDYANIDTRASTDVDWKPETWYRLEIDWHPGASNAIRARIYETGPTDIRGAIIDQIAFTDTEFDRGGITLEGSSLTTVDHFHLMQSRELSTVDYQAGVPVNTIGENEPNPPDYSDTRQETRFQIETGTTEGINYTVQVNAEPTPIGHDEVGRFGSEDWGDEVRRVGDNVWVIEGFTNTHDDDQRLGDTYDWDAFVPPEYGIVGFEVTGDTEGMKTYVNGTEIDYTALPPLQDFGGDDTDDDTTKTDIQFAVASGDSGGVGYTIQVAGRPTRVSGTDRFDAEDPGDRIRQVTDGVWEVNGHTGTEQGDPLHGDIYRWVADVPPEHGIIGFETDSGDYFVEVDGESVDPGATYPPLQDFGDTTTETTETSVQFAVRSKGQPVSYTIQTNAEPSRVTGIGNDSADVNDDITQLPSGEWQIDGDTDNGNADTFEWTGTEPPDWGVVGFDASGEFEVEVDGTTIQSTRLPLLIEDRT